MSDENNKKGETKAKGNSAAGIDDAINAARAKVNERKKSTAAGVTPKAPDAPATGSGVTAEATSTKTGGKAPKRTDEEKAAAKAVLDAQREASKAERDRVRNENKAKKEAEKANKPTHMSKVDKAASKLPTLNDAAQLVFNDATTNLTADQVGSLAMHLQHFNRVKSTEISSTSSSSFAVGQTVTIARAGHGTNPKLVGITGKISKLQRIRMYVLLDGETYNGIDIKAGNLRNDGKGWYFWIADADSTAASSKETTPAETSADEETTATPGEEPVALTG